MKKSFLFSVTFAAFTSAVLFSSCKKSVVEPNSTEVQTVLQTTTGGEVETRAATAAISSIGGSTYTPFVKNGTWLGNVVACGSGSFYGYYVINTDYSPDLENYMLINGSNFGTTAGSVTTNSSAITMQVLSWSNTQIKVRPFAPYNLDVKYNLTVSVNTKVNQSASRTINVIGMLAKGRGYGQCTWEAAFQRKLVNRSIPSPSAYSSSGNINPSYTPQQYDVLHWRNASGTGIHTGIIISVPQLSYSGGIGTYTFSLRERNQKCDEKNATTSTKYFKRSSTKITQGISSDNSGLGTASTYWR